MPDPVSLQLSYVVQLNETKKASISSKCDHQRPFLVSCDVLGDGEFFMSRDVCNTTNQTHTYTILGFYLASVGRQGETIVRFTNAQLLVVGPRSGVSLRQLEFRTVRWVERTGLTGNAPIHASVSVMVYELPKKLTIAMVLATRNEPTHDPMTSMAVMGDVPGAGAAAGEGARASAQAHSTVSDLFAGSVAECDATMDVTPAIVPLPTVDTRAPSVDPHRYEMFQQPMNNALKRRQQDAGAWRWVSVDCVCAGRDCDTHIG